mmetsp:Transcript_18678/g.54735  ORF Transcript_18678/g.54735 Transcript_18678/m.54735 type:complete len:239 (+) Transcript_18678:1358-2074(+)
MRRPRARCRRPRTLVPRAPWSSASWPTTTRPRSRARRLAPRWSWPSPPSPPSLAPSSGTWNWASRTRTCCQTTATCRTRCAWRKRPSGGASALSTSSSRATSTTRAQPRAGPCTRRCGTWRGKISPSTCDPGGPTPTKTGWAARPRRATPTTWASSSTQSASPPSRRRSRARNWARGRAQRPRRRASGSPCARRASRWTPSSSATWPIATSRTRASATRPSPIRASTSSRRLTWRSGR